MFDFTTGYAAGTALNAIDARFKARTGGTAVWPTIQSSRLEMANNYETSSYYFEEGAASYSCACKIVTAAGGWEAKSLSVLTTAGAQGLEAVLEADNATGDLARVNLYSNGAPVAYGWVADQNLAGDTQREWLLECAGNSSSVTLTLKRDGVQIATTTRTPPQAGWAGFKLATPANFSALRRAIWKFSNAAIDAAIGAADATLSPLVSAADGSVGVAGDGAAEATFSASGAGGAAIAGAGAGALDALTGSAAGGAVAGGSAAGMLEALGGEASGTALIQAAGSAALLLQGEAYGSTLEPATVFIGGLAAGGVVVVGEAAGALGAVSGSADGSAGVAGAAAGSIVFAGQASGRYSYPQDLPVAWESRARPDRGRTAEAQSGFVVARDVLPIEMAVIEIRHPALSAAEVARLQAFYAVSRDAEFFLEAPLESGLAGFVAVFAAAPVFAPRPAGRYHDAAVQLMGYPL